MSKAKKVVIYVLSIVGGIVIVLGSIAIGITGSMPCLYTTCHPNATCTNQAFYADCECLPGFNGNGKDHCDECGLTFYEHNAKYTSSRVVPYSWPATVSIQISYTDFETFDNFSTVVYTSGVCAGVLINRRTVITTSNCFRTSFLYYDARVRKIYTVQIVPNEFSPDLRSIYQLFMGVDSYVYYNQDLEHVFHSGVENIIQHPEYNNKTLENSLVIVKLKQTVPLSKQIQVACLPPARSSTYPDESLKVGYIAGFSTSGSTSGSWTLQNVELDLFNSSMCNNVRPNNTKNWERQFCAGEYNLHGNTTGFCHGDYGSALYVLDSINGVEKYTATGLLSYDVPCSTLHSPAVFTRLSYYADWIKKNSKY